MYELDRIQTTQIGAGYYYHPSAVDYIVTYSAGAGAVLGLLSSASTGANESQMLFNAVVGSVCGMAVGLIIASPFVIDEPYSYNRYDYYDYHYHEIPIYF